MTESPKSYNTGRDVDVALATKLAGGYLVHIPKHLLHVVIYVVIAMLCSIA